MLTELGLADAWPTAKEHLAPAIEMTGGTHDELDVFKAVKTGEMLLFVGENSAIVTEQVVYPRLRALRMFLGGGELEEIKGMVETIEEGATGLGFDRVEICGRRGWLKALPGYRELSTFVTKDLSQ